ncbi:hypothetical protein [Streptomyces sp. CBMA156]|uniref:hypothetical protein n=1 Tax=Streptomyces sp. CBMA156 TaxID=1930280 RepID=UPI0016619E39|nr:hypothetical protein [Streptomyces sp. CBMA156]
MVDARLHGDTGAMADYGDQVAEVFNGYRHDHRAVHQDETRRQRHPFWCRRQSP